MQFFEDTPFGGKDFSMSRIIEQLGQGLLGEMQTRRDRMNKKFGLQSMGFSPEESEGMSGMQDNLLGIALKQKLKNKSSDAFADVNELINSDKSGMQNFGQLQNKPDTQNGITNEGQINSDRLASLLGINKPGSTFNQPQPGISSRTQMSDERFNKSPYAKQAEISNKPQLIQPIFPESGSIKEMHPEKRKAFYQRLRMMDPTERKDVLNDLKEKEKAAKKEQEDINLKLKPYISEIDLKGGKQADESDQVLQKMDKLVDSGKLTGPLMYNFRKKIEKSGKVIGGGVGGALGALAGAGIGSVVPGIGTFAGMGTGATAGTGIGAAAGEALIPDFVGSKEDQEFMKLGTYFLRNLKGIFGAKPAIQEMEAYMKGIPNLSQTDAGKKAVIHDLRLMNQAARYLYKTKEDVLRETRGKIPINLQDIINQRSKSYLDKIKSQFLDDGLKSIEIDF